MIEITKCEAKRLKKEFPLYCGGKSIKNKQYGLILEKYLVRTQPGKSNRGKYVLTSSIQFETGESTESKINKLDELMAIMKSLIGIPQAIEAYDKLKVEKYKLEHPQWWDKTKFIKHPYFFAVGMNWIKEKPKQ